MPPIPSSTLPAKLLPNLLPSAPVLKRSGSLYQVLSVLPKDGIGARVAQSRWENKGIKDTYWEVTRVRLKDEGKHGKAWGKLVWKGRPIHEKDTLIRQGLKYLWKEVPSSLPHA